MNADSSATQNGKEVARWIATRDGIRSPAPVVPGVEKPEDWEGYRDGKLEDLAPLGSLGLTLVHLQDRFRVTGYSNAHENSDLRTSVIRRGA
jgi:hypothetical protein